MIVKGKNIIGLPVIALNKGKEIMRVSDIVYDPKANKVKALLVDPGGWFSDAKVIMVEDIRSIGKDAIVIESDAAVKKASQIPAPVAHIATGEHYLTNTKVMTEEGTDLGSVSDILFNAKSGIVDAVEVSKGLSDLGIGKKIVKVKDIVTIGENVTIVRKSTELKSSYKEQSNFNEETEKRLHAIRDEAGDIVDRAKKDVQHLVGKVKHEYKEFRDNPKMKRTVKQTQKKGENIAQEIRHDAEKLYDKVNETAENIRTSPEAKRTIRSARDSIIKLHNVLMGESKPKRKTKTKPKTKAKTKAKAKITTQTTTRTSSNPNLLATEQRRGQYRKVTVYRKTIESKKPKT